MLSQAVETEPPSHFRPHHYLARENERADALFRIEEGWAIRYRLLQDGRRQITALFLPGDYCEPQWALGQVPTQPIIALTNVRVVRLPCRLPDTGCAIRVDLFTSIVTSLERQASWLVSLGRKTAAERVAQLMIEIFERMKAAGLTYGSQCAMMLTQMEIADYAGLTPVHVNRTLQALRAKGLIELQSKWLRIPDIERLRSAAAVAAND